MTSLHFPDLFVRRCDRLRDETPLSPSPGNIVGLFMKHNWRFMPSTPTFLEHKNFYWLLSEGGAQACRKNIKRQNILFEALFHSVLHCILLTQNSSDIWNVVRYLIFHVHTRKQRIKYVGPLECIEHITKQSVVINGILLMPIFYHSIISEILELRTANAYY